MKELIYNQRQIPKDQWRYGFRTSAATGCGWVATHNALRLLGYHTDIPELIHYYERQLPLIHGNAGTSFWGPAVLFRQWGFPLEVSASRREFDRIVKESDACILFFRWHREWKVGAHFVALHQKDGRIFGYNTYRNSTGPDPYGESLEAFLKEKQYFGAVLLGIRRKQSSGETALLSGTQSL